MGGLHGRLARGWQGHRTWACHACRAVRPSTGLCHSCAQAMLHRPAPLAPCHDPHQGGYKAFWRSFSELCEGGYVPMDHPDYTHQLKVGAAANPAAAGTAGAGEEGLLRGRARLCGVLGYRLRSLSLPASCHPHTWLLTFLCLSPSPHPPPTGVPQRREEGVGAHHPHLWPQAVPAAAVVPAAPEHGGARRRQQGLRARGRGGGSGCRGWAGGCNGGGTAATGAGGSPARMARMMGGRTLRWNALPAASRASFVDSATWPRFYCICPVH